MVCMQVAPEKLITMFSLAQVAEMIVAFEDATIYAASDECEDAIGEDAPTVRPGKL